MISLCPSRRVPCHHSFARLLTYKSGMATQARDMTAQIKSQLKKEWAVWEANVLKRLTAESEKVM